MLRPITETDALNSEIPVTVSHVEPPAPLHPEISSSLPSETDAALPANESTYTAFEQLAREEVEREEKISAEAEPKRLFALAVALHSAQNFRVSLEVLNDLIALNPNWHYLHYLRGDAYYHLNYSLAAKQSLARALELQPACGDSRKLLDQMLAEDAVAAQKLLALSLEHHDAKCAEESLATINAAILLQPNNDVFYHHRGSIYYEQGNHEAARDDLQHSLRLNVFSATGHTHCLIAECHRALHDYARAIIEMSKAISYEPTNSEYHVFRGLSFQSLNQPVEAIENFSEAVRLSPDRWDAYYYRGVSYHALNQPLLALDDVNRALERKSDCGSSQAMRDRIIAELAAAEAERQRLEAVAAAEAAEQQRLAAIAAAEAEQRRLAEEVAAEAERQRIAREAEVAEQQRLAAIAATEAEQQRLVEEAAAAEHQRVAREAECERLLVEAIALYNAGNFQGCLDTVNLAISINPARYDLYYHRGGAFYRLRNNEAAKDDYNTALSLQPACAPSRAMLDHILAEEAAVVEQQRLAAIAAVEAEQRRLAEEAAAEAERQRLTQVATAQYAANQYHESIAHLNALLALSPNNAWAFHLRGHCYRALLNYPQAVQDMTRAIELDPTSLEYYICRAFIHRSFNHPLLAINDCNAAAERFPNRSEVHCQRGYAYHALGNIVSAKNDLNRALELNAGCASSRAKLDQIIAEEAAAVAEQNRLALVAEQQRIAAAAAAAAEQQRIALANKELLRILKKYHGVSYYEQLRTVYRDFQAKHDDVVQYIQRMCHHINNDTLLAKLKAHHGKSYYPQLQKIYWDFRADPFNGAKYRVDMVACIKLEVAKKAAADKLFSATEITRILKKYYPYGGTVKAELAALNVQYQKHKTNPEPYRKLMVACVARFRAAQAAAARKAAADKKIRDSYKIFSGNPTSSPSSDGNSPDYNWGGGPGGRSGSGDGDCKSRDSDGRCQDGGFSY